ncbi:hypothetical protein [Planobispora longispora]|uniref:Uncharacterized protein n=1 Tax=Planobispora longispora TaxID=28887 RepID=A0A8J3W4J2_9ACTN|nr:hypothetical protein [Planobispora longispora]BFE84672.1 hypothetical protein GCM10020093_072730 [Planobispora longispora]GIH75530.1 hypothetical protein Plo01_19590 [Planobispora longispora]
MDVVVQLVRTSRTKQSRGGAAAASRNALAVLNIAYGPAEREVFLGTPTRYVDERGSLR